MRIIITSQEGGCEMPCILSIYGTTDGRQLIWYFARSRAGRNNMIGKGKASDGLC